MLNLPIEIIEKIAFELDTESYFFLALSNSFLKTLLLDNFRLYLYLVKNHKNIWYLISKLEHKHNIDLISLYYRLQKYQIEKQITYLIPDNKHYISVAIKKCIQFEMTDFLIFAFEHYSICSKTLSLLLEKKMFSLIYFLYETKKLYISYRVKNLKYLIEYSLQENSQNWEYIKLFFSFLIKGISLKELRKVYPFIFSQVAENTLQLFKILMHNVGIIEEILDFLVNNKKKEFLEMYKEIPNIEYNYQICKRILTYISNQNYDSFFLLMEVFPNYALNLSYFKNIYNINFFLYLLEKFGKDSLLYHISNNKISLSQEVSKACLNFYQLDYTFLSKNICPELRYEILSLYDNLFPNINIDLDLLKIIIKEQNYYLFNLCISHNIPQNLEFHKEIIKHCLINKLYDWIYKYQQYYKIENIVIDYLNTKEVIFPNELEIFRFLDLDFYHNLSVFLSPDMTIRHLLPKVQGFTKTCLQAITWYTLKKNRYKLSYIERYGYQIIFI